MLKISGILTSVFTLAALEIVGCVTKIPPESLTTTRMSVLIKRVAIHIDSTGEFPVNTNDLPRLEGYDNNVADGWGRKILFSVDSMKISHLLSYGRDGIPGGDGLDSDIEVEFSIRKRMHGNSIEVNWRHPPGKQ